MGFKSVVTEILDTVDLIAFRLRGALRTIAALGIAFQGAIAAGAFKLPAGSRWDNAIAGISVLLAYYTTRGHKEEKASARAQAIDSSASDKDEIER